MTLKTNLVMITRDGKWYRMGDCSICLVTDDEYQKLIDGNSPLDSQPTVELTLNNITHRQVGALL
jgi:hypothetical protein